MLEVTAAAREYLVGRLADQDPDEACFRITPTDGQSYTLEEAGPEPADLIIRQEGRAILALEPEMAEKLDGWVLDVEGLPGDDQQLLLMPAPDFPGDGHAT